MPRSSPRNFEMRLPCRARASAESVLAALRAKSVPTAPGTVEAVAGSAGRIVRKLKALNAEIKDVRNTIEKVRNRIKEIEGGQAVDILRSAPGIGAAVQAVILSEAFDSVRRADLHAPGCDFGVAPVTKRSGQAIVVRRRLAANARLRNAACHWAMAAIRRDKVSRANCHALRRRQTPRRRLQNDRNRTNLRPGTAIERRTLETRKKTLDVRLRVPCDTRVFLAQFRASGQALSRVRPIGTANLWLPPTCTKVHGSDPYRSCAFGGALKAHWFSRSRLDGCLPLHCPRSSGCESRMSTFVQFMFDSRCAAPSRGTGAYRQGIVFIRGGGHHIHQVGPRPVEQARLLLHAERQDGLPGADPPAHAAAFHALNDKHLVRGFDDPRSDAHGLAREGGVAHPAPVLAEEGQFPVELLARSLRARLVAKIPDRPHDPVRPVRVVAQRPAPRSEPCVARAWAATAPSGLFNSLDSFTRLARTARRQRGRLEAIADGGNSKVKHARRARIVLLTDDGLGTMAVADGAGVTKATVWRWQERFMQEGVEGLLRDKTRKPGTPRTSEETVRELVDLAERPAPDGETHWTVRALAKKVGIGASTAHGILAAHRLAPHRVRQFKVSTDPKFAEKTREVIGLYMDPPDRAVVLSIDEKTQIQALGRTQKALPMKPGRPATMTHDYKRNGTTTLFAAMNILDGTVIGSHSDRHRY